MQTRRTGSTRRCRVEPRWTRWLVLVVFGAALPASCQKPEAARIPSEPVLENASNPEPADTKPLPERLTIDVQPDDSDKWLHVEAIRGDAEGAWATGSFDPERNKLDITTKHVQTFSIDVARIPIDWKRLVIIRLDGRSSELRKRDQGVYRFSLDDHGRWVVAEP